MLLDIIVWSRSYADSPFLSLAATSALWTHPCDAVSSLPAFSLFLLAMAELQAAIIYHYYELHRQATHNISDLYDDVHCFPHIHSLPIHIEFQHYHICIPEAGPLASAIYPHPFHIHRKPALFQFLLSFLVHPAQQKYP